MKICVFLLCFVLNFLRIQSYQTPDIEVVFLIKATADSVDQTYFSSTILPFVTKLSHQFVLTDELSQSQTEFARVTVNIGGTSQWEATLLHNQTRAECDLQIKQLTLPNTLNIANKGSSAAFESAVNTFYNSSVAVSRLVVLLTDEVVAMDLDSPFTKTLNAISKAIVIVGIPSIANPTFDKSLATASTLTNNSILVFPSIDAALNNSYDIIKLLNNLVETPIRSCHRIAFLYENSNSVATSMQTKFATLMSTKTNSISNDDGVALASFDDVLNNQFLFLPKNKVRYLNVKSSTSFDPLKTTSSNNVYTKLGELAAKPDMPYLDIVLLTQSDVIDLNTVDSMGKLGRQPNVAVFYF